MPDFTLDWTTANIDGANTLTSGGDSVGVGISTPATSGSDWSISTIAGSPALSSARVSTGTAVSATFDAAVENVEFEVFDVDSGFLWDDKITIIALDADGNQVPVEFSNTHLHTVNGNVIEGSGAAAGTVEGSGALDTVTVSIAGPIVSLSVVHDNGSNESSSGTVGIGEMGFDLVAVTPTPDGAVDGEDFDEVMELGYNDADGPTHGGGDIITEGDDTIFGNGGDDTISGEGGDDTIYGDSGPSAAGPNLLVNGSLEAGIADGTVNLSSTMAGWETSATGFEVWGDGFLGASASEGSNFVELDSSSAAHDAIWQDVTTVDGEIYSLSFDADQRGGASDSIEVYWNGDLVSTVQPEAGSGWETFTFEVVGTGGADRLEFRELASESNGSSPLLDNISLVSIDATVGNDSIDGDDGDDVIFGEGGDDTLDGGDGSDTLSGGAGRDVLIGGAGDEADGGSTGDDFDTLDLRGLGATEIIGETTDADGNSTSGTVNFLDADGNVTGSMEFSEIEEILVDPPLPGPVDGTDAGEAMGPGYTDAQGDMIDGADGDDDTILGNGGDDTIDSGAGDDTVDGGSGDDTFVLTDGIDNDDLEGSDTGETVGDSLDATAITADTTLEFTGDEAGTLTDGTDTTTFAEIESFVLGSGDDTVIGADGGDNVDGGAGDDSMTGGDGEDTLSGGDGEDTIDGGEGDDTLMGGGDNDTIIGGDGSDTVVDMDGDNTIDTGRDNPHPDIAYPGVYTADTDPNDDRDSVTTGAGNDNISTGDDADTIVANGGNDTIDAGFDDDEVDGGSGDDSIIGGEGNDSIFGNAGHDVIYGGNGPGVPDATNIPDDGSGPFGPDLVTNNGMDTIDGGNGNDMIFGEDDDDMLIGGNGADTLDGGVDDDTLLGGVGQDDLIGGQGMDSMDGGDDRDEFIINEREHAFGDTIDGGTGGNDVDTLNLTGLGAFEIVGQTVDADGDSTSGTVNFLAADGTVEGSLEFSEVENLIICFTPGSRIATPRGEVQVQDLQAGDRVITRDDGVQDIQWIGRKQLGAGDLLADPQLRPVLIRKGALGNNLPERDMMVSPNHRMLMANSQTQVLFDEREVLVAAKHLVGQDGIHQVDTLGTEYIHVMFDRHQVILGDGAWTESFQPGDHSLGGIESEQRDEIFKLFPQLEAAEGRRAYSAARQSLKAHEAKLLRETMAQ